MIDPFPWSEAFAVGDADLDEEHRCMVGLINQICLEASAGRHIKAIALLGELQFVSEAHFRNEEGLLHRIETEIAQKHLRTVVHIAIDDHARSHQLGLQALHRLVGRWRAPSAGNGATPCDELKSWFVEHAVGAEAQVKTILQSTSHLAELD
ncbi:MAG TPA: hemerythrin domain-containing protein [Stellaceae bacterium]|nr:hemerythrin domain-containing protein [Stellaceae bacterium]